MDFCSICLSELELDLATVPACAHIFHSHCLRLWSKQKALCPNCNTPFTCWLNLDDNSYVDVAENSPNPSDAVDLGCLDHAFFQEELTALKQYAEQVNRDKFIGRGSKATSFERQLFAKTREKLLSLAEANRIFLQYDTSFLMQEINVMHQELVGLKSGSYADVEEGLDDSLDSESSYDDYDDYYEY